MSAPTLAIGPDEVNGGAERERSELGFRLGVCPIDDSPAPIVVYPGGSPCALKSSLSSQCWPLRMS